MLIVVFSTLIANTVIGKGPILSSICTTKGQYGAESSVGEKYDEYMGYEAVIFSQDFYWVKNPSHSTVVLT